MNYSLRHLSAAAAVLMTGVKRRPLWIGEQVAANKKKMQFSKRNLSLQLESVKMRSWGGLEEEPSKLVKSPWQERERKTYIYLYLTLPHIVDYDRSTHHYHYFDTLKLCNIAQEKFTQHSLSADSS